MQNPFKSFFILPDSRKLAIYEWGDKNSKDIILCVHGLTRNARDFDFLAEYFSGKYRIIAIDVAGRGKSDWLIDKTAYHNFTYAQDINYFLQTIIDKNIFWVGTSMGGLIGMIIATFPNNQIKKLIINDIGAFIKGAALKRIAEYTGNKAVFDNIEKAEKYFSELYKPWNIKENIHLQHLFKNSIRQNNEGFYEFSYDQDIGKIFRDDSGKLKDIEDVNLFPLWENINIPSLILRGNLSDILEKEVAEKMLAGKTSAHLIEIENTGHAPSLMEKEHFDIIENFLNQ